MGLVMEGEAMGMGRGAAATVAVTAMAYRRHKEASLRNNFQQDLNAVLVRGRRHLTNRPRCSHQGRRRLLRRAPTGRAHSGPMLCRYRVYGSVRGKRCRYP
eukprot:scaffold13339_cov28-Tisochrysis_lutea.AAC.1